MRLTMGQVRVDALKGPLSASNSAFAAFGVPLIEQNIAHFQFVKAALQTRGREVPLSALLFHVFPILLALAIAKI